MKIPPEIIDLIQSGCHAHLVTLNQDGSPQVTVVWVGVDGDVYGSRDRGRSWHRTPGPRGAAEAIPPTGSGGTWPRPRGCTPPATRGGPGTSCCLTPGATESSV